ncbi:SMI1/KNR4 family protein [Streptomyces sp. NBC_00102]|uniref:SMI1/KNR4 family protein n=1 Tax=Streptomyces sp. NBC_00102 TaxID=2975652 RepID=UPI0022573180|nr:SMI1/KNR4 family protein [Streptomyces sp. NBC_00102]MCX5399244.1 SMI1/KNR4 family protein [Streptomyces sp. NBC_00102]
MTTDWVAEAERLARGHRHHEPGGPPPAGPDTAPPPLTEAEVLSAEAELGITFPREYREYLLRRTAGGVVNRLRRTAAGWGWDGDHGTNYALLGEDFPHPDSYRAREDELDAREPAPEDYPDPGAHRAAWARWDAEYEVFQEHKTAGAVFVQDNGCGFSTLLVVTGPLRGSLWFDGRASCDLILPLNLDGRPVSFGEWTERASMDLLGW